MFGLILQQRWVSFKPLVRFELMKKKTSDFWTIEKRVLSENASHDLVGIS